MTGASIGRYRIVSRLGAGGMGEVFLAEDTTLGRRVALKVLPASSAGSAGRLARFVQEARLASSVSHPGIAQIARLAEVRCEVRSGLLVLPKVEPMFDAVREHPRFAGS